MATKPHTNRRTEIADAAIAVLASEGSRGFTHRAVDRHLGIPEGSTSHYYRTRKALLRAAMTRLLEANLEETMAVHATGVSHATAARRVASLLDHEDPSVTRRRAARYELMLEAARDEDLWDAVAALREQHLAETERILREAGCDDPALGAPALMFFINGLLIDRHVNGEGTLSVDELAEHIQRFIDGY